MKNRIKYSIISTCILLLIFSFSTSCIYLYREFGNRFFPFEYPSGNSEWMPYKDNPIIGNDETGSVFDPHIIKVDDHYLMYVSTRIDGNIGVTESTDGINWTPIQTVLTHDNNSGWEESINRCSVCIKDNKYYMYYTGQQNGISRIGVALSDDGYHFTKEKQFILAPEYNWEGQSVMNPFVTFDKENKIFKMWYSAGETFEPDVVCYAESMDGISFDKYKCNPIFSKGDSWYDCAKVSVGHVLLIDKQYYMFYIGYKSETEASVCIAVSKDGKTNWNRIDNNPIIVPVKGTWNQSAIYKPTVIFNERTKRFLLYCNGRNNYEEYIGLYQYSKEVIE